jgi:hypothetical protein
MFTQKRNIMDCIVPLRYNFQKFQFSPRDFLFLRCLCFKTKTLFSLASGLLLLRENREGH